MLARLMFAAARMPDGCVVCTGVLTGNNETVSSADILEPPAQIATEAT
jgi:hypothetical protein